MGDELPDRLVRLSVGGRSSRPDRELRRRCRDDLVPRGAGLHLDRDAHPPILNRQSPIVNLLYSPAMTAPTRRKPEPPDLLERGVNDKGEPQTFDRRLYCQLQVFTGAERTEPLVSAFAQSGLQGSCWL